MRQLELYKYNPGQCPPEELEATFVAREAILDNILSVLRERACAPANQHFLLIGPRGIGKTNLLLILKHRLENDNALFKKYLPLQTAEEEYSIVSLRDLFTKVLELLLAVEPNEDLRAAAESVTLTDNDEHAAEIAIDAVKRFSERFDRKILLLLDNFDLILDKKILDEAQMGRLRDLLMNGSFLTLLATAPTHFKEVSGYQRPFYQFFHPIELKDLSVREMTKLLQKQAELEENKTLLGRFKELRPRINAVHHLTGGNPRLVLMLYQLYTRTELPEVRESIQTLLDDLTPYYKHRIEVLAPQQRKVLDTFARLGRPANPTELSRETRLPVNQINSILKRLRDLGFVSISPQKRRKTTLYMVSERVFRIWHQMRFSALGRNKLEFFIEFLRIWYTEQEWVKETRRLMAEYQTAGSERKFVEAGRFIEHLEYLAEAAPRPEMGYSVADAAIRACIESGDFKRAEEILNERINEYSRKRNNDRLAQCWYFMAYLRNEQNRTSEEINALEKAVQFRPEFPEALGAWGNALSNLARTKEAEEREHLFESALQKSNEAICIAESHNNREGAAFYSAHFIRIALLRCEIAVKAENIGQARNMFKLALDHVPRAKEDLALYEFLTFFKNVLTGQTAGICAELFGLMQKRNLERLLGILDPIGKAVEYWNKDEKTRDEVLDRLNPEVREVVEAIIQGRVRRP